MMTVIVIGGVTYIVGSYVLAAVMIGKGGPGGLAWLAFPLAPLLPPFLLAAIVKGAAVRVYRTISHK